MARDLKNIRIILSNSKNKKAAAIKWLSKGRRIVQEFRGKPVTGYHHLWLVSLRNCFTLQDKKMLGN